MIFACRPTAIVGPSSHWSLLMMVKWFPIACMVLALWARALARETPDSPPAAQESPRPLPLVLADNQGEPLDV
jgi:hypothetical protein